MSQKNFEERLKGGHPNSLGNTVEVVEEVLDNSASFEELFQCYFSDDEVVRLRTSNAMKRICKSDKSIIIPYIDRFVKDIAKIDQASTQWTINQLFGMLEKDLSTDQKNQATDIIKNNLAHHQDWIVLNTAMDVLGKWAKKDEDLKLWMKPHLKRLSQDERKSIKGRAEKVMKMLG